MTSALADARTAYLTALADAAAIELTTHLRTRHGLDLVSVTVSPDMHGEHGASVELLGGTTADGDDLDYDDFFTAGVERVGPGLDEEADTDFPAIAEWAANPALGNTEDLRVPSDRTVRTAITGMRDAIDTAASHDASSLSDLIGATNGVVAALRAAGTDNPRVLAALNAMDGWHGDIDRSCGECFGNGGFDADGDPTEYFDPDDGGSACENCEGSGLEPDGDAVTADTIDLFTARWEAVNAAYRGHTAPRAPEAYTPLHIADECDECGADITGTTDVQSFAHDRSCSLYPASEFGHGEVFARLAGDVTAASAGWHGARPTRLTVRADVAPSEVGTGRGTFDVIAAKGPDYERTYRGNDWWLSAPADIVDPTRRALSMAAGTVLADMPVGTFVFDLDVPPNDGGGDGGTGTPDGDGPGGRLAVALADEIERRTGERPVRVDIAAEVADDQVGSGAGDVFVLNYRLADGTARVREETNGWALHALADDSVAHVADVRDATERFLMNLPVGVTPVRLDVPADGPCGWCDTEGGADTLRADHTADCPAREAFCGSCDQIVRGTDWGHLPDAHADDCPAPTAPTVPCRCGGIEECECPPPKPCDHCAVEFDDHADADRPARGHDPACPRTVATISDPLLAESAIAIAARAADGDAGRWVRAIAAHAPELVGGPAVRTHLVAMVAAAANTPASGPRPDGLAGAVADAIVAMGAEPGRSHALCADPEAWERWFGPLLDDVVSWVQPLGGMPDAAVAGAAVEAVKRCMGVNAKSARRMIGQLGGPQADETVRRVVAASVGPVTRHTVDALLPHLLPDGWTIGGTGLRICLAPDDGSYRWAVDTQWPGAMGGDWSAAIDLSRDGDRVADVPTGLSVDGGTHPVKAARRVAALADRG